MKDLLLLYKNVTAKQHGQIYQIIVLILIERLLFIVYYWSCLSNICSMKYNVYKNYIENKSLSKWETKKYF